MSFEAAFLVGAGVSLVLALLFGLTFTSRFSRVPPRANYAGREVRVALGIGLVGGTLLGFEVGRRLGAVRLEAGSPILWGFVVVLFVAGWLDDQVAGGPRGFGGHLRSLVEGRFTTGILKLVAGLVVAVWLALHLGGGPLRVAATVVLVAVTTNLWNALDVRPGRALKWAIPLLVASLPALWGEWQVLFLGAVAAAGTGVLPLDLGERGMLGDAGSNPLGFAVGAGLVLVLPTPWLIVAAVSALAVQLVAETVTISRLIDAAPPLRWFDRLGRRS